MSLHHARKIFAAGGFALAVVAAPAIAVVATPASDVPVAQCAEGQSPHPETGACVTGPNLGAPSVAPGNPDVPMVDGIPCIGHHAAECVGLEESQAGSHPPVP